MLKPIYFVSIPAPVITAADTNKIFFPELINAMSKEKTVSCRRVYSPSDITQLWYLKSDELPKNKIAPAMETQFDPVY